MLFASRAAWQAAQQECPDLRRTHSIFIKALVRLRKPMKIEDDVVFASVGFLIVRESPPFHPNRERIVVPRSVIDGLLQLTALNI